MARRHCIDEDERKLSSQSSSPFTGLVTLQPSRKAGPSLWRSTKIVAPGEIHSSSFDTDNASAATQSFERFLSQGRSAPTSALTTPQRVPPYRVSTTTDPALAGLEHRPLLTDCTDTMQRPPTLSGTAQDTKEAATSLDVSGQYDELFGKLPDPIRLHEQEGKFDGQVVFIGHPNRDVSAHQWSASFFQWENIGRYTYLRGKIEGSLACDRVKDHDSTPSALHAFKLAAENREKLIVESGRMEEMANKTKPKSPEIIESVKAGSVAKDVRVPDRTAPGRSYPEGASSTPAPLYETIKKVQLEDPFVDKPESSNRIQPGINIADVKGSLDMEYKFPVKAMNSAYSRDDELAAMIARDRDRFPVLRPTFPQGGRPAQPGLREIGVGEEAPGRFTFTSGRGFPTDRAPTVSSTETADDRRQASKAPVSVHYFQGPDGLQQTRKIVSAFDSVQPTARSLFPSQGLTIANPHRVVPHPNTAAPENKMPLTLSDLSKALEQERKHVQPATTAALQFSDPDGSRQTQGYDIANGFSKQQPTVQNFKGPFFTASKPTTNDPTASLAIPRGEEEKLQSWFQDGHRLARQREYATTLMSTAANGGRQRHFGAIGDASYAFDSSYPLPQLQDTQNTLPFVRLYDTLSEYVDETRNGSGKSYFTRAWKPAPPHLRDFGPDGNNSFFSTPNAGSTNHQPGTTRKYGEEQQNNRPGGLTYSHSNMRLSPGPGAVGEEVAMFKKLGKRFEK
jgi:hypothetical protein